MDTWRQNMDYTETKLRRVNSYQGIIVGVTVDQVRLYDGGTTMREVVEHPEIGRAHV